MQVIQKNVPVTGSTLQLLNSNGDYIDLPREAQIEQSSLKKSVRAENRQGSDGDAIIGDRRYKGGQIKLRIARSATPQDPENWRDSFNVIEGFFHSRYAPIYLIDKNAFGVGQNGLRAEVVHMDTGFKMQGDLRRVMGDLTWNLAMPDPLWETVDEIQYGGTSGDEIIMTGGDTLTVTNDSQYDAFPIFEFTARNAIAVFRFTNRTLEGGFEYTDSAFIGTETSGKTLIVDSTIKGGSVTLNGVAATPNLSAGGFIHLVPGNNTLLYESVYGDVSLVVRFRERHGQ